MASNRKSFDKAMKKAANHVRKRAWTKAIKEYNSALKEFPDDATALVGLGAVYLESDQLESAQEIFQGLQLGVHDDPVILSHLATFEERLGNADKASAFLMDLGALCREQGDLEQAAEAWTRATQLVPALSEAYHQLVQAYTDLNQPEKAVALCLAAARELQAQGQTAEIIRMLRSALQLDPRNKEATRLLELARVASDVEQGGDGKDSGPIASARRAAWTELALMLFEDLSLEMMSDTDVVPAEERLPSQDLSDVPVERSQVIALIGRAVDLDSKGHAVGAIQTYREVIRSGVDRVAVHFNLGLLYKSQNQLEEACRHLSIARFHPDYALASHLALGECYQWHNRFDLAMQHYVRALKVADLRVVNEMRVSDIVAIYDSMIDGYGRGGQHGHEQSTVEFFHTLRSFFQAEDWLERVVQLRTYLDGLSMGGMTMSLADGLKARNFDRVFDALGEIRHLEHQDKLLTAREECYRAIERDPTYLPLHFCLADICIRQGMVNDAVSKYMIVAELYEIDDDLVQASNVYRAILSMAPLDVTVRSKLIDMLINHKEIDQALEHYLALADAYYQLARVDKALETFNEALRLTERSQSEEGWRLKILYFMADLYTQRVEWNEAIEVYEQIRQLAPEDDQAVLYLMDLYFKQGKTEQAMQELQGLLQPYEEQNNVEAIVKMLGEAAHLRPNELPIRARLSRAYIEAGMKQEAIEELDAIGEMQLEADMRDEAIQTIRLIISLKPPNVRAYKQLLYHLLS